MIGYSFALANELGLDVSSAIRAKMVKNAEKYPAEKYRGRYETRPKSTTRVNQPLAIVGASTRSAAASAVRAGFQPLAADLFADADLRRIATATRIRRTQKDFSIGCGPSSRPLGCTPERSKTIRSWSIKWRGSRRCWGNPGDVLARVRSPWELAATLRERRFVVSGNPRRRPRLAARWFVAREDIQRRERQRRAGVGAGSEEQGATEEASRRQACFQKRIDGMPCAAVFVAAEGERQLLGVTRQLIGEPWLGAHGFQYAGSIGPWPVSECARKRSRRSAMCWLSRFRTDRPVWRRFYSRWRASLDARSQSALHGVGGDRRAIHGRERDCGTCGSVRRIELERAGAATNRGRRPARRS